MARISEDGGGKEERAVDRRREGRCGRFMSYFNPSAILVSFQFDINLI